MPRFGLGVAFVVGAAVLAVLALGGYILAERFVLADETLQSQAVELVPPGGEVLFEGSTQCARSGWNGLFTFRDTCHELSWRTNDPDHAREAARQNAESLGWRVVEVTDSGTLILSRAGYRGAIGFMLGERQQKCLNNPDPDVVFGPGACNNYVILTEE
jgi:hypothetical protein